MIGTVYKIEIGEKIYIGSTIQKLSDRQRKHNFNLKQEEYKNKLYKKCRENNITKIICILLEEKEIEDIDEIRLLEQEYITKLQPSLNHCSAYTGIKGITIEHYNKQYRENNIDKIREQKKEYRKNNVEKIKEKKKQDYIKNREHCREKSKEKYIKNRETYREYSKTYRENNREDIIKKQKEYYITNKEIVLEKQKENITCPICGFVGRKNKLNRHQKTKKCLESKELVYQIASKPA